MSRVHFLSLDKSLLLHLPPGTDYTWDTPMSTLPFSIVTSTPHWWHLSLSAGVFTCLLRWLPRPAWGQWADVLRKRDSSKAGADESPEEG